MDKEVIKSIETLIKHYSNSNLTNNICSLQKQLANTSGKDLAEVVNEDENSLTTLKAAMEVKSLMGQINIIIHALGIINSLPYILENEEVIESVSLGADNSGSEFDLVTNKRIAEFKFIAWKGKDSMRLKTTFIDYYELVEYETNKEKDLYLIDSTYFIKCLKGKRKFSNILSKNTKIAKEFEEKYGAKYTFIYEYFNDNLDKVNIISLKEIVPDLFD
ncbi:MAG: hypothetical protein RR844_08455 [Clostridium sp.]